MQLLATINDSKQWQQVLASCQLEQLSKAENINDRLATSSDTEALCVNEALSLEALEELLAESNTSIVLAFNTPEYVIGTLVENGQSLNDALAIWLQQTLALLQLQKQHRKQLQLVQTEGLLIKPTAAPEWLAIGPSSEEAKEVSVFSHNIHHLMAAQILRQEPDAERSLQRLIASSLPLLEQPEVRFNLDDILQEYVLNKDQKLTAINDENALLQTQLCHVQEELEQLLKTNNTLKQYQAALKQDHQKKVSEFTAKNKQSEQAVSKAQQEAVKLKAKLENTVQDTTKAQQALKSSTEENGLLQEQLFHVQEELETSFLKSKALTEQQAALEQNHQKKVSELTAKNKQSEQAVSKAQQEATKLKAKLENTVQDTAEAQQALKSSTEENGLLQEQLFHVQEELETSFLKNKVLTEHQAALEQNHHKKVSEFTAKNKQSEQAVSKAQQEAVKLKAKLENTVQDTAKAQQALKSSTEENGLLQEQLFKVQEELEQLLQANKELKQHQAISEENYQKKISEFTAKSKQSEQAVGKAQKEITELQTRLTGVTQELQSAQQQVVEGNNENELLLKQLFYVQEELEKLLLERQTLTQQHSALKQERSNMQQQLSYLQKELERVLQKNQKLAEENAQAQAEAEQYRLQCQQLEASNQQQQIVDQGYKAQLEHELEVALEESVRSKHQLASAQTEISAITSSKFWKTAASVRRLKKGLLRRNRESAQLKQDITLIAESEYFDEIWYLKNYPDVMESGVNPAEHYLLFGATEGRAPGPMFDGHWYLSEYPDVAESSTNPLLHYVMFGAQEGRTATPKLLPYLTEYQDIKVGE